MSKILSPYGSEPAVFTFESSDYTSKLATAFNWYNQEKEKKDARNYLRSYVLHHNKQLVKVFDTVPDSMIKTTYGWLARMVSNGTILTKKDNLKLEEYLQNLFLYKEEIPFEAEKQEKVSKPSVRDFMQEKVNEYLGEVEGYIDAVLIGQEPVNLFEDLKYRQIPQPYVPFIDTFIKSKAAEYIMVYESTDDLVKEGYSNLGKRKITALIKLMGEWLEDVNRYGEFKKANRKPRIKKAKSPLQQTSKLKFKKEDSELKIKSISPTELVGASQVWVYNTKYKKLSVYRTDSASGIQVKGSTLQNYDPDMCEQKALRKPEVTIPAVLTSGKVQLRKLFTDLSTKESKVNGRINEECVLLRAFK